MKIIASRIIVKVQIPLAFSGPIPDALIYNQDRKYTGYIPYTGDAKHYLNTRMEGQPKAYFYADVVEEDNGEINIDLLDEAPWQDW